MSKEHKSSESGKVVAGVGTAGLGGGMLLKSLRRSRNKEVIKDAKKAGDHIYRRALSNRAARNAAHKAELRELGQRGAGWFGSVARRAFSETGEEGMAIKRFSKTNDEN
jgi:hypothetical protein